MSTLRFESVLAEPLAEPGGEAADGAGRARLFAAAALAAEQAGVADRLLELTVEYVKDRRQFGGQIGPSRRSSTSAATCWSGRRR